MRVWIAVVLLGCSGRATDPPPPAPDWPTTDTDTVPTDTDTDPPQTTPTGDTGGFTITTTWDCSLVPQLPRPYITLTGYSRAEDFDFDAEGFTGAVYGNDLVRKNQAGEGQLIAPNISPETAGTRILATGDWVVADHFRGQLVRVDTATGNKITIASNLDYPNGVEVDAENWVYVAEQNAGKVKMVHAYDETQHVVARGLRNPNGVVLSPDEQVLYVGSFGGGSIYAIDRISQTEWAPERKLYQHQGWDNGYDGIAVDDCGNVYWTEYIVGKVWGIDPAGRKRVLVAELPSQWIPNMRWGNDLGGWDDDMLYVSDREEGRLFGLHIGIPGKRHLLHP